MYRHTYAEIDLDAVRNNVQVAKSFLDDNVTLLAVVKSNAYGHGAVKVAEAALEAGAGFLAVAIAEEAVELRDSGIKEKILVLGVSSCEQIDLAIRYGLDICVASLRELSDVIKVSSGREIRIHLKTDTGMGRIGFSTLSDLSDCVEMLKHYPNIKPVGLFSHFACADGDDAEFTLRQYDRFSSFKSLLNDKGIYPDCHICNSAALFRHKDMHEDMARLGISLYGYGPCVGFKPDMTDRLKPVMKVFSEIVFLKDLPAGNTVSYGATFKADTDRKIATVPIGYGDGYNRLLSNKGKMIVLTDSGEFFADVVGRVCMDQTMIDVTDIPDVKCGDSVIILGSSGDKRFDADDMAELCGTISYEILLSFNSRIPRRYINAD